jgi:hypothetical protein
VFATRWGAVQHNNKHQWLWVPAFAGTTSCFVETASFSTPDRFSWRGVDKFRLKAGKIIEEVVYCDTAPLRALRTGETLEPITKF